MKTESDRRDRRIRTMPAIGFALAMLFVSVQSANAQWTPPSSSPSPNTNIYYNSGNVGIGTTSPAYKRDVVGTGTNVSGTSYWNGHLVQDQTTYRGVGLGYDTSGQIGVIGADSNGAASNLALWTYSGSAWGERVRISGSGNVGIGTTSPSYPLHVFKSGSGIGDQFSVESTNAASYAASAHNSDKIS